jgi:Zn-finger nucleic acid-binding protein
MVKNGAGKGNVKIDVCNVCGAKFLDYGELEKIREFSDTEYKETPQEQVMYNQLAEQVQHETLGSIGMFFNEHFKSGNGRKEVENFMNGFLANRRHVD